MQSNKQMQFVFTGIGTERYGIEAVDPMHHTLQRTQLAEDNGATEAGFDRARLIQ